MRIARYATTSYLFFLAAYAYYLAMTYTYFMNDDQSHGPDILGDGLKLIAPAVFAGVAAAVIKLFKHPAYMNVFYWVLLAFSIILGLFSLLAGYLSWWSANQ